MNVLESIEKPFLKAKTAEFHPGDTIQVHVKVKEREAAGKGKDKDKEKEKERIQIFEGVVIGLRGRGILSIASKIGSGLKTIPGPPP